MMAENVDESPISSMFSSRFIFSVSLSCCVICSRVEFSIRAKQRSINWRTKSSKLAVCRHTSCSHWKIILLKKISKCHWDLLWQIFKDILSTVIMNVQLNQKIYLVSVFFWSKVDYPTIASNTDALSAAMAMMTKLLMESVGNIYFTITQGHDFLL